VKDLQGVDTLGSITLLASDKTGTITQNKMTAVNVWSSNTFYILPGGNLNVETKEFNINDPGMRTVAEMACLCSKYSFLALLFVLVK
jgi:sodium/potassium-transporting ATPase subunit alpha